MKITLNLLPEQYKDLLRKQKIFRLIANQQLIIFLIAVVLLCFLVAIFLLVGQQVAVYADNNREIIEREEYGEVLKLHALFAETNAQVEAVGMLQEKGVHWSGMLHVLNQVISTDIRIKKLVSQDYVVTLTGVADKSSSLVSLKNKMLAAKRGDQLCFDDVQIPDEYLVRQNDADFVMTFTVNPDTCLVL